MTSLVALSSCRRQHNGEEEREQIIKYVWDIKKKKPVNGKGQHRVEWNIIITSFPRSYP